VSDTRAVVLRQPLTPAAWDIIRAVSPVMYTSRFFGVASPEQAMAISLKGHELGLGIGASFEFIVPVMGKPTLSPRGALAIVMASGLLIGFKLILLENPIGYQVWMKRSNGLEHEETFTLDDAKRAGLVKKDGAWEAYPKNMAKWRAIGFCIDVLFSDVVGGMKRADEFGAAVDTAGNVVEGEWQVASATSAQPEQAPASTQAAPSISLDDLVARHGAEVVMSAAGGRIPATMDEVASVAARLANADEQIPETLGDVLDMAERRRAAAAASR
jgi:hypothetical protein